MGVNVRAPPCAEGLFKLEFGARVFFTILPAELRSQLGERAESAG